MNFVDTNYFLRLLLRDNTTQHTEAKSLFLDAAEGKVRLITSTIVMFEVYWVLQSYYGKVKEEVIQILSKIMAMNFIILDDRHILQKSLELFEQSNFSLEDCYNFHYAKSKNVKEFKTFDIKLAKKFK